MASPRVRSEKMRERGVGAGSSVGCVAVDVLVVEPCGSRVACDNYCLFVRYVVYSSSRSVIKIKAIEEAKRSTW